MDFKTGLLVITILVGCISLSTSEENDAVTFLVRMPIDGRIVTGDVAPPGRHPYMVALTAGVLFRGFLCGGSLITTRSILTAAHCIDPVYKRNSLSRSLRATVGTNRWKSGGTEYTFQRNVTHPNFVPSTFKNDIGILVTSTEVALTNFVSTVPVTYDFIPQGINCRVSGWGATEKGGTASDELMQLDLVTIDGGDCVQRLALGNGMKPFPVEPHIEVCTLRSPGFGICKGDSGSPLVLVDNGHQFGIVSWGLPCARGVPDGFTRISAYKDWMQANVV